MTIVLDGTNGITSPDVDSKLNGLVYPDASSMGFRNRIINGDMRIDQRNAGAAVTIGTSSTFGVDRWQSNEVTDGAMTVQQSSVAPVGFSYSQLFTTTTADASLANDQFVVTQQKIEGFNTADLGWGTASAQAVTLSFWVRSSLTGTFGGVFQNDTQNRTYPFTYAISAANTWEQKTVTVAGDTTGTWLTTNGVGIRLLFDLGSGPNLRGTAGAWAASGVFGVTGTVSPISTSGATWQITGVQLEAGTVATPFERRDYGRELMMCQRYFVKWTGDPSGIGFPMIGTGTVSAPTTTVIFTPTPATLRVTPTTSFSGTLTFNDGSGSATLTSVTSTYTSSVSGFWMALVASGGGLTVGRCVVFYAQAASTNSFSASSEL